MSAPESVAGARIPRVRNKHRAAAKAAAAAMQSSGAAGGGDDPDERRNAPGRAHEKEKNEQLIDRANLRKYVADHKDTRTNLIESAILASEYDDDCETPFRSTNARKGNYDMSSTQYRNPALAHQRGVNNNIECDHCSRGAGPWEHCRSLPLDITVPDGDCFWDNACTNCAWGGHEARCSFYTGVPRAPRASRALGTATPGLSSAVGRVNLSGVRQRSMFTMGANTASAADLREQARRLVNAANNISFRADKIEAGEEVSDWSNDE